MERKYENVTQNKKKIFVNNLIGGLAWGIGATLGLAFLVTALGLVAHHINLVPIIGNFVSQIIDFVLQKNPHLGENLPFFWTHYAYA